MLEVSPSNLFNSEAVAVINVLFNLNPVVEPLCPIIFKLPCIFKLDKVPNDVIFGWLAVWIVPVKKLADNEFIFIISLLPSKTNVLNSSPIPGVVST